MPEVSVLLPVYNTPEDFLRQAVESILNQTFQDFELLIVNDASTTDVEKVISSYSDPRIKYFKNKTNLGISGTRNILLDKAQGKYLAVMDHDDVSLPERLAREVDFLDRHPNVGVVSCQAKVIGTPAIISYPETNAQIESKLLFDDCIIHPAALIRHSVLKENRIRYEEEFTPAEDYALWCRLLGKTEFHNLSEILFMYRDHPGNTSHRRSGQMARAAEAVRGFVRREHPELWNLVSRRLGKTTRIKLFNLLPLLTIYRSADCCRIKLFGLLPLFSVKTKISVPGV